MISIACKNEILIGFYINNLSRREISETLGVSRKTVSKYIDNYKDLSNSDNIKKDIRKVLSKAPTYKVEQRSCPSLTEEITREIDNQLIKDFESINKGLSTKKITSREIHSDLIRAGHSISYSTVCKYVRLKNEIETGFRNRKKSFKPDNFNWFHNLLHGAFNYEYLYEDFDGAIEKDTLDILTKWIISGNRKSKNKAISVICFRKKYSIREISRFLLISRKTVRKYIDNFQTKGLTGLSAKKEIEKKYENPEIIKHFFKIFHSPPSSYGINRTTWIQKDLKTVFEKETGITISIPVIRKIIKNAGYRLKKAKKVLTSKDPDYKEKVKKINLILSNLKADEKFFSIDEYGPFAIKIQGGRSYAKKDEIKTYPQWQKSKGCLIMTAALELSKNQVTHFYSQKKNTTEMIKLLEILLKQYHNEKCIYFSWDAASWHASKELYKKVDEVNKSNNYPKIELAPLPNGAQFLNIIESVFSGMARAIIHNSNYASIDDCKAAIDRYFMERNEHFKKHPKRAGNKIWKYERVIPKFDESNNCKDSRYER